MRGCKCNHRCRWFFHSSRDVYAHRSVRIKHITGFGLNIANDRLHLAFARPAGAKFAADCFQRRLGNIEGAGLLEAGHRASHGFRIAVIGVKQQPLKVR